MLSFCIVYIFYISVLALAGAYLLSLGDRGSEQSVGFSQKVIFINATWRHLLFSFQRPAFLYTLVYAWNFLWYSLETLVFLRDVSLSLRMFWFTRNAFRFYIDAQSYSLVPNNRRGWNNQPANNRGGAIGHCNSY